MKATQLFALAVKERLYFLLLHLLMTGREFGCMFGCGFWKMLLLGGQVSVSWTESCYMLVQNSKDQRAAGNDMSLPHANNLTICVRRMQKQFKKCRLFLLAINSPVYI